MRIGDPTPRRLLACLLPLLAAGCGGPPPRVFQGPGIAAGSRVAILPFVNYTEMRAASDRLQPLFAVELTARGGLVVVDPGVVEEALAHDPWLATDRMPPDVIDRLGADMGVHALLIGDVLAFGYRTGTNPPVPEVSVAVKLLETPGGRCVWSAVHSREGTDREHVFGLGRIESLERLAQETVSEAVATLPVRPPRASTPVPPEKSS